MKVALIESIGVSKDLIYQYADKIIKLGHEFEYYSEKTTNPEEIANRCLDCDVVMIANTPFPQEALEKLDNLKLLNVAFTGLDHVPLEKARDMGVKVINAAGYSDIAVAEMVLGLVLDIYRNISIGNEEIRDGGMPRLGKEIRGKTLGIIGTGNIGIETARLFKSLGVKLLGFNRSEKDEFTQGLGGQYVELEELLRESDIVSLHLPANDETENFLGEKEFSLMKEDAILINCARGRVVDNDALADSLNRGQIGGAGIDVYDMEPPIPKDYKLLKAKNTILTPHVAYLTEEALERRAEIVFDNTIEFLKS